MKTQEELNAIKQKVEALNKKLALLPDDALQQVTGGGSSESGILDNILQDVTNWLDKHPNATKLEIYMILKEKKEECSDELTEEDMNLLNELINSFVS